MVHSHQSKEREAASGTEWRLDGNYLFPAYVAQEDLGCIGHKRSAGKAERGKEYVKQRPEKQGSKPHLFIHHQNPDVGIQRFPVYYRCYPADSFGGVAVTTEPGLCTRSFVFEPFGVGG